MTEAELEKELLKRGIRISVWGCGCCGSPELTVWFDDAKEHAFQASDVDIDMEPPKEPV